MEFIDVKDFPWDGIPPNAPKNTETKLWLEASRVIGAQLMYRRDDTGDVYWWSFNGPLSIERDAILNLARLLRESAQREAAKSTEIANLTHEIIGLREQLQYDADPALCYRCRKGMHGRCDFHGCTCNCRKPAPAAPVSEEFAALANKTIADSHDVLVVLAESERAPRSATEFAGPPGFRRMRAPAATETHEFVEHTRSFFCGYRLPNGLLCGEAREYAIHQGKP